jgi:hypothetical protein
MAEKVKDAALRDGRGGAQKSHCGGKLSKAFKHAAQRKTLVVPKTRALD